MTTQPIDSLRARALPVDEPSSAWTDDGSEPAGRDDRLPAISVIMPVRNEEPFIGRSIEALLRQDYPQDRYEILVVDGRSQDRTRDIVSQYAAQRPQVRLLDNPKFLSSAARNVGVRESKGEIVLVVDGHCQIDDPRHLSKLAAAFARSGADCVGRPQPLEVESATTLQKAIAAARSSWLGHHPSSYIYSAAEGYVPAKSVAVAYRRDVFDRVGYFDEHFDACEDVEFNHRVDRAGLKCFFTPEVAVHYAPRATLTGLARQLTRYGRGRVRLLRKHRDTFSLGSMLPAAFVAGCLLGPFVCWLLPPLFTVYAACLVFYIAIVLAVSVSIALRMKKFSSAAWLAVVFSVVHFSSGLGSLVELLSGGESDAQIEHSKHTPHPTSLEASGR